MDHSQTISIPINRPASEVYEFASNPANLPSWVRSFCLSVKRSGDDWLMETPTGFIAIRFAPRNDFGVLDHVVTLPDGQSFLNPMRVVSNGDGSEIMFTLFQTDGMTHEQFAKDSKMIAADLQALKAVMEGTGD